MRRRPALLLPCAILCLAAWSAMGQTAQREAPPSLVPWPKSLQVQEGVLALPADGRIVATDAKLQPLADVLAEEIYRLSGRRLARATAAARPGDIVLEFDPALKGEQYALTVSDKAEARGGTYRAVAWATVTLVQALKTDGDKLSLPRMAVKDEPDVKYRSAECDIARKWHPLVNLYEVIDLFRFYKVDHIQFHMNDHGLFTFGAKKFPKLPTVVNGRRHYYTIEELKDLVAYADARGVTIVPEIEMPGHSDAPRLMPEFFGTKDPATGQYKSSGYVNACRDDTVEACKELLNEVMDVFASSECVSIGADEVADGAFAKLPEYAEFQARHPGEAPMMRFIAQMDEAARKRGKKLLVYGRGGPKDVLQMPWTGNDTEIIKRGYDILTESGGSVTQHLATFKRPPYNTIMLYTWFRPGYEFDFTKDKKIAPENYKSIFGIHTLTWQHWHFMHFYDLRKTMASISENAWNYNRKASLPPFEQWRDTRWAHTDKRLDDLVFPVKVQADGLLNPKDWTFYHAMQVKLSSARRGTIRYRKERLDFFNPPDLPTAQSPAYAGPITITEPTVIYAALFDAKGNRVGYGTEVRYWPIVPKVRCTIYGLDRLKPGVTAEQAKGAPFPDTSKLAPVDTVPLGWLTSTPSHREMFMGGYFTVQEGQIKVPADGEYEFIPTGTVELLIDGQKVVSPAGTGKPGKGKAAQRPPAEANTVSLKAGLHAFTVLVFPDKPDKVLEYKGPGDSSPKLLDNLLVVLPEFTNTVKPRAEGLAAPEAGEILSETSPEQGIAFRTTMTLALEPPPQGEQIRYTLDGATPAADSPLYEKPIVLTDTTSVMARRFDARGRPDGYPWQQRYELRPFAVTCQGCVGPEDTRFGRQATVMIKNLSGREDVTIRCTPDGGEPTASSPACSGPLKIETTQTIKARMFDASGKSIGSPWERTFKQVDYDPANPTFNKPVTTSGRENDGFFPSYAVDGVVDISQYWGAQPAPQWWQVDLGRSVRLNAVRLYTWWGDGRYYQYKVSLSLDGQGWTDVIDASANTAPSTPDGYRHEFAPADGRYVRVTMLKNSANPAVHLVEVRAFEAKE